MPVPKKSAVRRRPAASRAGTARKPEGIRKANESKKVFMGLFSHPGIGKTTLIGSLMEYSALHGKVLIIKPPTDHTDSVPDNLAAHLDVWTITDHEELGEVLEYLRYSGSDDYEWIWFDSITLLIDHLLDAMWEGIIAEKPHRAKYNLDQGEYYNNMVRLSRVMRHIIGLQKVNVGWTAHTMMADLPSGSELLVPQIHVKGMWSKFCAMMNFVGYYEVVEQDNVKRRVLRVQETDGYYAKNQLGQLPKDRMVDPTMKKLLPALGRDEFGNRTSAAKTSTVKKRPLRKRTTN